MYDFHLLGTNGIVYYWLIYGIITGIIVNMAMYMYWSSQSCIKSMIYPTSSLLRKATGVVTFVAGFEFLMVVGVTTLLGDWVLNGVPWYQTEWGMSCAQQLFVLLFMPFLCFYFQAVLQGASRIKPHLIGIYMLFPLFLLIWTIVYGALYAESEGMRFSTNILTIVRVYWLIFIIGMLYAYTKSVREYERKLLEMYSDITNRQVKWLYVTEILMSVYFVWFIVVYYFGLSLSMGAMVQHILALILTVYACYHADRQRLIVWESEASEVAEKEQVKRGLQELTAKMQIWLDKKEYLRPDFTRDDMLEKLSTNRTYLNMYFTTNNTSFYQFVNVHRIEHAVSLLNDLTTSHKLSEIAIACGYNSLEVFSRQFKAIKGCLPSQYRVGNVKVSNNENED